MASRRAEKRALFWDKPQNATRMAEGPARGGTRGGRDQFSWNDVKESADREFYLGHSVKATTGRWCKGKDVYWYNRDKETEDEKSTASEFARVKAAEEAAMRAALGLPPLTSTSGEGRKGKGSRRRRDARSDEDEDDERRRGRKKSSRKKKRRGRDSSDDSDSSSESSDSASERRRRRRKKEKRRERRRSRSRSRSRDFHRDDSERRDERR